MSVTTTLRFVACAISMVLLASPSHSQVPAKNADLPAVAIAPLITCGKEVDAVCAPDHTAKAVNAALEAALNFRGILVLKGKKAAYTMRGFVVSAAEKSRTKIAYIWDVSDKRGKRVHRLVGEEIVVGPADHKNPWSRLDEATINSVAVKSADQLAEWLNANKTR